MLNKLEWTVLVVVMAFCLWLVAGDRALERCQEAFSLATCQNTLR